MQSRYQGFLCSIKSLIVKKNMVSSHRVVVQAKELSTPEHDHTNTVEGGHAHLKAWLHLRCGTQLIRVRFGSSRFLQMRR